MGDPADLKLRGSSPLTRGKHGPQGLLFGQRRLIPAHAGKTRSRHPRAGPSGAHPRSRGENAVLGATGTGVDGSSPLTRGKREQIARWLDDQGLIPAHAGKTAVLRALRPGLGAHPRSRGENVTRGKATPLRPRLIPAHAGKTTNPDAPVTPETAHPRSRGENRSGGRRRRPRGGLIPAHAGKTSQRTRASPPARAHPRSRGENFRAACRSSAVSGSSPLTRGKHMLT